MQPSETSAPFGYVKTWHKEFDRRGWWHSFELPGNQLIQGVSTVASQKMRIAQFPIPEDLKGKRVLDIGTWDGWFALEMERRGAEVVAIDRWENPRFYEIRDLLGSRVEYRQMSVYDLDPAEIGHFDIVLLMGVLYHLKHPLLALERACAVSNDFVAIESFVLKDLHQPGLGVEQQSLIQFFENDEFGGEFDNWTAPTTRCLLALCRTAGLVRVTLNNEHDFGAAISGYRKWTAPENPNPPGRINLVGAFHTANGGINFDARSSDEYVACRILMEGLDFSRETILPEVSGYAAAPVFVGRVDGHWEVDFKLPPGLASGWHQIQLRTPGAQSNVVEIAVDVPAVAEGLRIGSVCDGISWTPGKASLTNAFVSLWIHGLPRNSDIGNVKVSLAGRRQITTFVGPPNQDGVSQVNARIRPSTPPGRHALRVQVGDATGCLGDLEIIP